MAQRGAAGPGPIEPKPGDVCSGELTLSGAALEDLLADLMDGLRTLDEGLKAFKLLDRPLYNGYTQARKIINSGGGGLEKPAAA